MEVKLLWYIELRPLESPRFKGPVPFLGSVLSPIVSSSGREFESEFLQPVGRTGPVWRTRRREGGPYVQHAGLRLLFEMECGLIEVGRLERIIAVIALQVAGDVHRAVFGKSRTAAAVGLGRPAAVVCRL